MKTVELSCHSCGIRFFKPKKEHTRRLKNGHTKFFCSLSCGSQFSNLPRALPIVEKELSCEYCGKLFTVSVKLGHEHKTHCSISCASSNSVTETRREGSRKGGLSANGRANLSVAKAMKSREAWKYVEIRGFLENAGINWEFEYELFDDVFDLALPELGILIEFDGPHHKYQRTQDAEKDSLAKTAGWQVIRIDTAPNCVLSVDLIKHIFQGS